MCVVSQVSECGEGCEDVVKSVRVWRRSNDGVVMMREGCGEAPRNREWYYFSPLLPSIQSHDSSNKHFNYQIYKS